MRQLRSLLVEIYPPNLRNAGLAAALSDLVARAAGRGLDTSLAVDDELGLPEAVEQLLFRAAQEGLRNVVDHAAASSVAVEVHREDGRVELTVSDDGRGFTSEELAGRQRGGHVGLRLIGDRARELGGALEVESEAGRGTRLTVRAPL
jgi:signal transduction histidine kinase